MRCFLGINLDLYHSKLESIEITSRDNEIRKAKGYHITLVFYADYPENKIEEMKEKLSKIEFPKFKIIADKVLAFPNKESPRLYALGFKDSRQLEKLRKEIEIALNEKIEEKFSPHVTLFRVKNLSKDFKKGVEEVSKLDEFEMEVRSFGLYQSVLETGMNEYKELFSVNFI